MYRHLRQKIHPHLVLLDVCMCNWLQTVAIILKEYASLPRGCVVGIGLYPVAWRQTGLIQITSDQRLVVLHELHQRDVSRLRPLNGPVVLNDLLLAGAEPLRKETLANRCGEGIPQENRPAVE